MTRKPCPTDTRQSEEKQPLRKGAGALVVLDDPMRARRLYLSGDRPGRQLWEPDPRRAKVYLSLADATRAALLARRRGGRPQPYAIPAAAILNADPLPSFAGGGGRLGAADAGAAAPLGR